MHAQLRPRSTARLLVVLAASLFVVGCGGADPLGAPSECAPGTPAACAGADVLRLCVAGVAVDWPCAEACAAPGAEGVCVARGAAAADCVCTFALEQRAPSCPAPGRLEEDRCACDSPARTCAPSAFDGPLTTIAFCADGEVRYEACRCPGNDTPSCVVGDEPGTAACRCEPGPRCGDGVCAGVAAGEDCETCPSDCGCGCGETCRRGACVFSACEGRVCGDDGCGGTCGPGCGCGEVCRGGACEFTACAGAECGFDTAGCGVPCGPGCDACFEACAEGRCEWVDRCAGRTCGSDGCGGVCGTCACGETCDEGQCLAVDLCAGRECGADACGQSCGDCAPGSWCDGGACVSACEGTVCGAPGYGPLACCTGAERCVGFECCVPDDHWVCVDERTRRRADSCGNPSDELDTCPGACDPATGFCAPCEAFCTWGVCREGRCEPAVCGDGRCEPGPETVATCPADCAEAPTLPTCRAGCLVGGERRCAGRREVEICADPDGDGCLVWTADGTCPGRSFCVDGHCAALDFGR